MSVSTSWHAAVKMPLVDRRSAIELEEVAPTWAIKELLVSAPSKDMLLDLLIKIETELAKVISDVKEMNNENRPS